MPDGVPAARRLAFCLAGALAAASAGAQAEPAPPVVAERIAVVARAVAFDVVDARGRPVEAVRVEDLELLEDGVPRTLLEVRPRAAAAEAGAAESERATVAVEATSPQPIPQGVLVALDPETLDQFAWKDALRSLGRAAESLAGIGPVEIAVLGTPGFAPIRCGQEAQAIRAALDRVGATVAPRDRFYDNRERFLREARFLLGRDSGGIQLPGARQREEVLVWFDTHTRELAEFEVFLLGDAQRRLSALLAAKPRPLVAVWVGAGDPQTGEFVRQFFEDSPAGSSDAFRVTAVADGALRGARAELEQQWRAWGEDGVQVVAWAPARPLDPSLASASYRRPSGAKPQLLATDPIGLFDDAARATGGVLVRSGAELPAALESARGRFVLVYQSDRAEPGWRRIEVRPRPEGWSVRAARSLPVFEAGDERAPELPVELAVARRAGSAAGTESIRLETRIEVAALLDRYPRETPLRFDLKLSLTLPSGKRFAREAQVATESIPVTGAVLHRLELTLPAGARDLGVEVRERATGARGAAVAVSAEDSELP